MALYYIVISVFSYITDYLVELYSKCISTTFGGDASKLFPQFTGMFLCSFVFISLDKIILFVIGPISDTNKIVQT